MLQYIIAYLAGMMIILFVILVLLMVLRWLNPQNDADHVQRRRRQNVLGVLSAVALAAIFMRLTIVRDVYALISADDGISEAFPYVLKICIKAMAAVGALMLIFVIVCLFMSLVLNAAKKLYHAIFSSPARFEKPSRESAEETKKNSSNDLMEAIRSPEIIGMLTISVIAAFIAVPLLLNDEDVGLAAGWRKGVEKVGQALTNKPEVNFTTAVVLYLIVFIIVMGILVGAANIIHIVLGDMLSGTGRNKFLREYSTSIAVLAVSLGLLFSVYFGKDNNILPAATTIIKNVTVSLASAVFIFTVIVVVLELMRLLMDMSGTLLREESGFIFVYLLLLGSTLVAEVLYSLYSALSGALAVSRSSGERVKNIYLDILDGMCEAVEKKVVWLKKGKALPKKPSFKVFDRKITRK